MSSKHIGKDIDAIKDMYDKIVTSVKATESVTNVFFKNSFGLT